MSAGRSAGTRRGYERPVLKRYPLPEGIVTESYQATTGERNSRKCTDPDLCTGGGEGMGAPPMPDWLVP